MKIRHFIFLIVFILVNAPIFYLFRSYRVAVEYDWSSDCQLQPGVQWTHLVIRCSGLILGLVVSTACYFQSLKLASWKSFFLRYYCWTIGGLMLWPLISSSIVLPAMSNTPVFGKCVFDVPAIGLFAIPLFYAIPVIVWSIMSWWLLRLAGITKQSNLADH